MERSSFDTLALRLPPESADPRRRQLGDLVIEDPAVERYNALLSELSPQAPHVSADQLATLARWLQGLPGERAEAILSERIGRAECLRRMLDDDDWATDERLRERARRLVAYLYDVDDLIPDDRPLLGHLDDALLVELAWPAFRDEAIDYGDFCRFRSEQRPRGTPAERRLAWETACVAEAALVQQRRDVRARPYAAAAPLPPFFRVG